MFRVSTLTIVLFLLLGTISVNTFGVGGFSTVPKSSHDHLLAEINNKKHAEFGSDVLMSILCAQSQVIAGRNYRIVGLFMDGNSQKTCEFIYTQPLNGDHFVLEKSYDCVSPPKHCTETE